MQIKVFSLWVFHFRRWLYIQGQWPVASQPIALVIIFLLGWGIASSLFPGQVYVSSTLMRIILLFIGAQASGYLVSFFGLPGEILNFSANLRLTEKCKSSSGQYFQERKSSSFNLKTFLLHFLSLFAADMLGMIGFGGKLNLTFCGNLIMFFKMFSSPVLYKNIGAGYFDGYEKLEAVLR